ncbi:hypothetical protein KFE25_001874 [Diacronema lutheri]|uniref:Cyclic nucleotide-binding domain-containing protein n=1 Tax=Diacronema lutheri TaxID=2081491 RepID=A0A8J6CFX8_DIALT|nr:hypothetical protein KFE25_001874 [Diacronema lutheri]
MGWIFGAERASTGLNASAHSILKKESGVKRHKARVKWRTHIVGEDGSPQEDAKRLERTADLAPRARLLAYFRSVRLPALVYELIILPMRIAYDRLLVETPALLVLDLLVDTVEAAHIVQRLRERAAWRQPEAAAAKHGRDDAVKDQPPLYSRARLIVDVISILLNYVGRLVHYVAGTDALFIGAQLLRIGRIHDLAVYMADISADLSTNTAILAVSKFALVAFAVPHWISCGWWASAFYAAGLSEQQSEVIPLPSWVAQFEVHTGNSAFADVETSLASRYLITTYFAWLGLTSNGYADIKLAGSESILFCIAVMLVQVVFYAFVLGTLFHFLYLVFANADVEKLDRRSNSPLVDALNHSNEAAAILVSYCGLQLPSKQRAEKNLVAIMDGARAQDMSATNRKLRFRTHLREKAIEDSQRRQRELGHAFNTLAHDLSVLTRHFTTIYDALDERASRWLEAYTDADEGSDGDSAASSQDIDPADFVDDDNASDTSSIGAAVDCRRQSSAAGGLRNSAGTANEQAQPAAQLRDAAPHASAADGGAPLPPQVELPPHPGESAKTFIAIVLRLPQAERGLSWLRKQYEESLPSDGGALRSLPPAERMREEERVLDELLTAKLLLEPDEAQHVREEIYEQIGHITGGAERRKTSIFGAERRGSAGGAERYQPGVSDNLPAADAAARAGGVPAGAAGTADFSAGGKLDERSADSPLPVRRASVPSAQPPALGTPTGAAAPGMYLAEMGYAALFCSPLLVAKLAALSTRKFGMRDRLGTGAAASADAPDGGATLTPNARGLVPGTAEHAAALRNGDALDGGSPLPSPAARRASKRPAWLTTTPLRSSCASRTPSDDATAVGGALAASAGIGGGGTIVPLDTQAADALRALESRTRPAPYGGEARRGRVRTWGAAESSMRLSSPGSGAGSPVGRGELLYSRRRIRASETISAERLLVAAEAARVRKDGGYDVLHDDARRDAIEACAVLSALFGVFDRTGRGKIRLSDVRLLQGALGEMGSSEIQSLVAFLVEAAQTLNPARRKRAAAARAGAHYVDTSGAHAERRSSRTFRGGSDEDEELRVARKLRVLTRVQFFVGAASWVLASLNDEDGADVDASHARAPRAGGLAAAVAAADAAAAARRHGAPWRIYDAKADVAAALSDLDERDASASLRRLHEALLSAAALRALADALTDRIVGKKLDGRRAVEPEALLALTKHVVAIPVGTRALDLLGWARETLRLPLSDAPSGPSQLGLALAGAPALHFASGEGMSRGGERRGSIAASEAAADRRASNAASTAGLIAAGARTPPGRTTWAHLATALGERASALMDDPVDGGAGTDGVNSKLPHARALDVLQRLIAPRDDGSASIDVSGAAAAGNDRRWFIVDHRSPLCLGYRALFETFAVFDALFIPLQLCFYAEISRMAWVHRVNLCTDVFYWGQVALRFLTTFVNEKSVTVTSPADIRRQYLATDFLVDTVAFWPQNYLAGVLGASTFDSLALRLFRMLAARYPYGSYRNWEKSRADIKLSTGIAQQLVLIAIGVHMLACVYTLFSYSVGSTHATPGSWAARYDEQLYALQATESTLYRQTAEGRLLRKYEVSVMFVLQALTRTGQTQLPSSYGEICFLVLLMILSVTAFAWAIGRISTLVMKQDNEIVTKRTALQQVLFRTTELCKELAIITLGAVRVFDDPLQEGGEQGAVATLVVGETIGDVAFIFGLRHFNNASCESDGPATLATLSLDDFKLLLKVFPAQEDVLMDNAMMQFDGVSTSRSGRSVTSARTGKSGRSAKSRRSTRSGRSTGSSYTASNIQSANASSESAIQAVISTARVKRNNMHTKLAACTFILSLDGVRVNFEDRYGETAYDDALRTEGKLRQVVSSLIAAFGGKRGSKVMRPSAERARAEQAKALVDLSTVESMRTMVVTAMRLGRWTTAEVKSARALAKRTSEACELEDDEGPVLADARPTYLHAVCDFAQEHHQRTSNFVGKLKPLLHEWQKMQDQYGTLKQEIQRRLSTIINMQEKITFALDSLREARFRAPSASA